MLEFFPVRPVLFLRELAMMELQERKNEAVRLPLPKEWDSGSGIEGVEEEDEKDQVRLVVASRTTEADEANDRK